MLTTTLTFTTELTHALRAQPLPTTLITGDCEGHEILLALTENGNALDLSGSGVWAYFLRGDGATVTVQGSVRDGQAAVLLPQECYGAQGRFSLIVQLHREEVRRSVLWLEGSVAPSRSDLLLDTDAIPSLEELTARISAMDAATQEARMAAIQARSLINDSAASPDSTWSSEQLSDVCCPRLSRTGSIVSCTPAPHMPLDVRGQGRYCRSGRNLIGIESGEYAAQAGAEVPVALPEGDYVFSCQALSQPAQLIVLCDGEMSFDLAQGSYAVRFTAPAPVSAVSIRAAGSFTVSGVMLESGSDVHPWEPHRADTGEFTDGCASVAALPGVNMIWAQAADVTVHYAAAPADVYADLDARGAIPLATGDAPGAVKIGAGLRIDADGTLSATGSGGSADSVAWERVTGKPDWFTPAPHTHPELAAPESPAVNQAELLLLMYPVGSIYQSADPTSPAQLFGGTWKPINDRFLLSAGAAYPAGTSGGAASVALINANLPEVGGEIEFHQSGVATSVHNVTGCFAAVTTNPDASRDGGTKTSGASSVGKIRYHNGGASWPHENLPPYLSVYTWVRVA